MERHLQAHFNGECVRGDFSIGEVASKAGLRTSAIRYYERVGLLPPADRRNGRRRYDDSVLRRLAVIHLSQQAGFTIAESKTLLDGFELSTPPSRRWRKMAGRKLDEVEERIERAREMKRLLEVLLQCECPTLDDCAVAGGCAPT